MPRYQIKSDWRRFDRLYAVIDTVANYTILQTNSLTRAFEKVSECEEIDLETSLKNTREILTNGE